MSSYTKPATRHIIHYCYGIVFALKENVYVSRIHYKKTKAPGDRVPL